MLAVNVLVQAIEVAWPVSQEERRRLRLTRRVAAGAERLVRRGIADIYPHRRVPAVGDWRERTVQTATKRRDHFRQRIGEILVLPPAEDVSGHHDARAEAGIVRIERRQGPALLRRQKLRRDGAAIGVELRLDGGPIKRIDRHALTPAPLPEGEGESGGLPFSPGEKVAAERPDEGGPGLHAASRSRSARLRSTPHR
jgi:hypothetical protein